jgi:hypothetical protein
VAVAYVAIAAGRTEPDLTDPPSSVAVESVTNQCREQLRFGEE